MMASTGPPSGANEVCVGPSSEMAGKADSCAGCPNKQVCLTKPKGPDPDVDAIAETLANVKHKILVLSGKGGVGKSTFAAQLSFALAGMDKQVGLLDIDICGPSVPKMLGLEGEEIHQSASGWSPVYVEDNLGVMSIGFLLNDPNEAVVWRGPRKNGLIKQFLKDVNWGELDYMVVDAPPGTSDEHISIVQYLKGTPVDGAIIVTTPQEVSLIDVRKEINFCKKVGLPVIGVVENMAGLHAPVEAVRFSRDNDDGTSADITDQVLESIRRLSPSLADISVSTPLFYMSTGGAEQMSRDMGVPFLGRVPMDPELGRAAEEGRSILDTESRRRDRDGDGDADGGDGDGDGKSLSGGAANNGSLGAGEKGKGGKKKKVTASGSALKAIVAKVVDAIGGAEATLMHVT